MVEGDGKHRVHNVINWKRYVENCEDELYGGLGNVNAKGNGKARRSVWMKTMIQKIVETAFIAYGEFFS